MSIEIATGCAAIALMTVLHIQHRSPMPATLPLTAPTKITKLSRCCILPDSSTLLAPNTAESSRIFPYQTPKNFLNLPRELRDHIYHYAWSGTMITVSRNTSMSMKAVWTAKYYDDATNELRRIVRLPRWLYSNRQLLDEGLQQWYQHAQFVIGSTYLDKIDLEALRCISEFFDVKRIQKLEVEELIAAIDPPQALRDRSLAPYVGIVIGSDIKDLLGQHKIEGLDSLKQVSLKVEWLPYSINSEYRRDIDDVFEDLLPDTLQSLEIKFVSNYDSSELRNRGTAMLTLAQFDEAQTGLTQQCRRLAANKVEDNEMVKDNMTARRQILREGRCKKGRVYQRFVAGPKRILSNLREI